MNGVEENIGENKKQIRLAIIGIVAFLLLTFGATFAYFLIDTDNSTSKSNIKGDISKAGLVTLIPGTSNLHINLKSEDMAEANQGAEYYGDELESNPYVLSEEEGTHTISQVQITDGEETTKYSCTAKVVVTMEIAEDNNMGSVLEPGDLILQFKGNLINEKLDLSEISEVGTKEYNLSFKLTGNTTEDIEAYIKLINKSTNQNYLASRNLKVDINTTELSCDIATLDQKIAQIRNDSHGTLSSNLIGDLYRYQGLDKQYEESDTGQQIVDTNYICFGTIDEGECKNDQDQYMYRIIGINDDGQMKLIKETFIEENETVLTPQWHNIYEISVPYTGVDETKCDGENCEWPNVRLFKRLNGLSNGTSKGNEGDTNIFLGTSEHPSPYKYLTKGTEWYNLIEEHNWMYGDTSEQNITSGDTAYAIETGSQPTKRYWLKLNQYTRPITEEEYTWSKSVKNAKIGLMYLHDYFYSYSNENISSNTVAQKSWIYFKNNSINNSIDYEWLIDRFYGVGEKGRINEDYYGLTRFSTPVVPGAPGDVIQGYMNTSLDNGVRPTFYLSSNAKIKNGDGTKDNPYILSLI